MERGFAVPAALDDAGLLVKPEAAERGQTYRCPGCGSRLVFRAGAIVARHFAHPGGTGCSPETVLHKAATLAIAAAVEDWLRGSGPRPATQRPCVRCKGPVLRPAHERVRSAVVEHGVTGGRVADVALLDETGEVVGVIEVRVTHAVDAEKTADLDGIPWIEVDGADALADPVTWRPIAAGGLGAVTCDGCRVHLKAQADLLARLVAELGVSLPDEPYYSLPLPCESCGQDTIVSDWPGNSMFRQARWLPMPRPTWIRFGTDPAGWRGWLNHCLRCDAPVEWFPLYDYGGLFFGSNLADTEDSWGRPPWRAVTHAG